MTERFAEMCLDHLCSPVSNWLCTADDALEVLEAVLSVPGDRFGPEHLTAGVAGRFVDAVFCGDFSLVPAEIRPINSG